MKSRVDTFIEGADDSFHVPGVTVTTGTGDSLATVKADFREMLLSATPKASLGVLARAAVDVLGYRYPTDANDVDRLLGVTTDGEAAEAEQAETDE